MRKGVQSKSPLDHIVMRIRLEGNLLSAMLHNVSLVKRIIQLGKWPCGADRDRESVKLSGHARKKLTSCVRFSCFARLARAFNAVTTLGCF